jgi:hypothetical protein
MRAMREQKPLLSQEAKCRGSDDAVNSKVYRGSIYFVIFPRTLRFAVKYAYATVTATAQDDYMTSIQLKTRKMNSRWMGGMGEIEEAVDVVLQSYVDGGVGSIIAVVG